MITFLPSSRLRHAGGGVPDAEPVSNLLLGARFEVIRAYQFEGFVERSFWPARTRPLKNSAPMKVILSNVFAHSSWPIKFSVDPVRSPCSPCTNTLRPRSPCVREILVFGRQSITRYLEGSRHLAWIDILKLVAVFPRLKTVNARRSSTSIAACKPG